jgi:hypothetical protein
MGVFSSSSSSKDGSGGSNSSSSSSHSMDSAVADSSSKSRVACWKRVYVWPYGEDGRVWGFNQAADGLFITSSAGRWVWLAGGAQGAGQGGGLAGSWTVCGVATRLLKGCS